MPTLEEYASDPDDMALDLPPAPAPAAYKGKGPAAPPAGGDEPLGHDGSIPKALRVAPDGQFVKPSNDEYTK